MPVSLTPPIPLLHGAAGIWDEVGMIIGIVSLVTFLGFMAWSNGNKRRREQLLRRRKRILAQRQRAEQTADDVGEAADDVDAEEALHTATPPTSQTPSQPTPSASSPLPKSSV